MPTNLLRRARFWPFIMGLKCGEDQTRDPRDAKRLRDFSVGRNTDHINRVSSLTNECDVSVPLFLYVTI